VAHGAAANPGGPSGAFPGLVDLLGEVFQGLGAVLEPLVGRCGAGGAEQVPGADRAVPAAQPVQALFFLIQLGERQLALRDLTGPLGFILAAIRPELAPLGRAPPQRHGTAQARPTRRRRAAAAALRARPHRPPAPPGRRPPSAYCPLPRSAGPASNPPPSGPPQAPSSGDRAPTGGRSRHTAT